MTKSTLLALDTSTDACSVALLVDGEIISDHRLLPREHTQNILPMVEGILSDNNVQMSQLDGLIVGAGPGSFTGLRIAFGVVQGLAFALDKPVAVVSTLAALAVRAKSLVDSEGTDLNGDIIATVDARMNELYWGRYSVLAEGVNEVTQAQVSNASDIDFQGVGAIIGTGLVYQDQMRLSQDQLMLLGDERPRAADMLQLCVLAPDSINWTTADLIEPLYVRNDVAKKKADQKPG